MVTKARTVTRFGPPAACLYVFAACGTEYAETAAFPPAGGGLAGTAATAGRAGTAGTANTAGEMGTGGAAGETGTGGAAGETGTGGAAGETGTGGTAGETGTGGTAGDAGTGGTAGAAGTAGGAATAGSAGSAGAGPPCPALEERLSVTTFTTDVDIRYKHQSYDYFPTDERIALSRAPSGELKVAWLENSGTNVRVTPLSPEGERIGDDLVVPGFDVGGLVAQDDGFMLLTRREDPGEPLRDPAAGGQIATAGLLVRVRNDSEAFAAALTGTASIVEETRPDHRRDCASVWLNGRLAFNGEQYGAYFQVHGCEGHWQASYYGDKLVYADDDGLARPGGWDWKCSINQGIRMLPEADRFTALCLSDGLPARGLNVVTDGGSLQLAEEMTNIGYCAGQFGSLVKLSGGGYVVGWLSRDVGQAAKDATDIAILRLGANLAPSGPSQWVVETPNRAEANLHLAAYGSDQLLVVWDSIDSIQCSPETCFGSYSGTHARLMDPDGNFLTPDALIPAPPSTNDDLVVLPNGDLIWAFVPDPERDYDASLYLDADGVPIAPERREIGIARLRYCE